MKSFCVIVSNMPRIAGFQRGRLRKGHRGGRRYGRRLRGMAFRRDKREPITLPHGVLLLLVFGILLAFFGVQWIANGLIGYSESREIDEAIREQAEEQGLQVDPEFLQPSSFFHAMMVVVGAVMLILGVVLIAASILWRRRIYLSPPESEREARTEPSAGRNEIWFCRNCGNLDLREADFCPECGEALGRQS
jgi:hypothetical protein